MNSKVTLTALVKRINRRLAHEGTRIKKCRTDSQFLRDLGEWYAVNTWNCICGTDLDPEEFGRELGVLKNREEII